MPSSERRLRAESLRQYTMQEIEDFQLGSYTAQLSSYSQLSMLFSYTNPMASYQVLTGTGLIEKRRELLSEPKEPLAAGAENAWLLGLLAGGGYVRKNDDRVIVESKNLDLLNACRSRFERAIDEVGLPNIRTNTGETSHGQSAVSFSGPGLKNLVGDMRRASWYFTIIEKFPWVLEQNAYVWKFLEGFYEKRGSVVGNVIRIHISDQGGSNFMIEMLTRVGTRNPVKGTKVNVLLTNSRDTNIFSNNIHPVTHSKEQGLRKFRSRRVTQGGQTFYTSEEITEEWAFLCKELGRTPTSTEIDTLYEENLTRFNHLLYAHRFGKRSFREARIRLEELRQAAYSSNLSIPD